MKNLSKQSFRKEFISFVKGYPDVIGDMLMDIFDCVIKTVPDEQMYSLLLIGSTSRYELTYTLEGGLDILSDIEFLLVTNGKLSSDVKSNIFSELKAKELEFNIPSPLFHIDIGISTLSRFKLTPPTLFAFELKTLGVPVYGADAREDVKEVNLTNLDFGNLNELIIVRLWNMLTKVNNSFVKRVSTDYETYMVKFFYSRNVLDILTILLPNKGFLKGGYISRQRTFSKKIIDPLWVEKMDDFARVLDFKIRLEDTLELTEVQSLFFEGYVDLLAELSGLSDVQRLEDLENSLELLKRKDLFRESPIKFLRKWYIQIMLFIKYYRCSPRSLRFLRNDHLRLNILFLLFYVHRSLINNNNINDLRVAMCYFNEFQTRIVAEYHEDLSYFENYILFREELVDFMMIWFYARSNTSKTKLKEDLNWKEK